MNPRLLFSGLVFFFLALQLVPGHRTNPPVGEWIQAPEPVEAILRRSCFDCHSNQTRWPWYAYVAPTSWLVSSDVDEGRDHLNFSTWEIYDEDERIENLEEIMEVIEDGEMPPWFYLPLHPEAELDDRDREILNRWIADATGG